MKRCRPTAALLSVSLAGLLMPASAFRRALVKCRPGLSTVESLAGLCRTSLPAAGIRYAELSEDAIAVIVSTGTRIDYCCLSDTMKSLPQLAWLRKGSTVPRDTATAELNANPGRVATSDRAEADIDVMDWLGGARSVPAIEEVIGLGGYGKTLTVLTCPSVQEETYQEENDEDDLAERWTPRFRR